MLNFIVDASVFALPAKSEDAFIEKEYLCSLKNDITELRKLHNTDSVTISYMNKILLALRENNSLYSKNDINRRIKELLVKMPEYNKEIGLDSVIFEDWDKFLFNRITPKATKDAITGNYVIRKGKIGIFNNIPDRDNDPSDDYMVNTDIKDEGNIFSEMPDCFSGVFRRYCGYMADLNQKYHSYDSNFIVLGGNYRNLEKKNLTITLDKKGTNAQSYVTIVGIEKAETLCPPKVNFKTLDDMYTKAQKFSEQLDFGGSITNNSIAKDLSPQAGPPGRVYRYLEALKNVFKIVIDIPDDNTMIEMLNSHGLLCSSESGKYLANKCIYREFTDRKGKKIFCSIHLKPSTYTYIAPEEEDENYTLASKYTVRIYLYWNGTEKKIIVGWIGHHPPFCKDCLNTKCQVKIDFALKQNADKLQNLPEK
jgi:hypothetical protein